MSVYGLMTAMKELVEDSLASVSVEPDDVPPKVHLGYLPFETLPNSIPEGAAPLTHTEAEDEPFVIIRAMTGEDEANENDTAKIVVLIGTKDPAEQGYMDVLHIMENVRRAIARKHFIGQDHYESFGKVKWIIPEDQPWPIWTGYIETNWILPGVEKEDLSNGIY